MNEIDDVDLPAAPAAIVPAHQHIVALNTALHVVHTMQQGEQPGHVHHHINNSNNVEEEHKR